MFYVLCSVVYVLCSVFYVLCSMFCGLCSVFYVLCSVFYVLCSMFCVGMLCSDLRRFEERGELIQPVVFSLLVLLSVMLYFTVSLMDPGFILTDSVQVNWLHEPHRTILLYFTFPLRLARYTITLCTLLYYTLLLYLPSLWCSLGLSSLTLSR